MKLKGDLDSIGLAELFQTLSSQRATGLLTVTGSFGEKLVAIAHGEIAVLSDKIAERVRLGDLLVARGKLTDAQLNEALKIQRTSEQRSRLGDVLVKQGMIKPQDIADSLKFQLEEEIYELFTWKGASFEFDGEQSVDDAVNKENSDTTLQRMYIEPQTLIAEASRRVADWQTIENRLPTPYLCFKLSPKGEELCGKAALPTQQIVKLLKEGRTIETTVKKSCLGRFNVCKAIVKLLDEGWVFPYPAGELRYLASEHRANGRFSDALYVYRRMLEATQQETERSELEGMIDDTLDAIRRAQDAGESVEGADTISFKEAAGRYKRKQRRKRVAALVLSGVGLIGATFWLTESLRPPPGLAEAYQEAHQKAADARRLKKFKEAVDVWREFQKRVEKRSPTYAIIEEQVESLQLQDDAYLREVLARLKTLQKTDLAAAEREYNDLLKELTEKTPDSPNIASIKDEIAQVKASRQQQQVEQQLATVKQQLVKARELFTQKKYTAARNICVEVSRITPAGSPEDKDASELFKQLSEIEARSMHKLEQAKAELDAKRAEKAIEMYVTAAAEWADLPSAENGLKEAQRLKTRLEQLKEDISAADNTASRGLIVAALERCQEIQAKYSEFELTSSMNERTDKLKIAIGALDSRIKEAQRLLASGDKAQSRKMFAELAREHLTYLVSRSVELPVTITSDPSGAKIQIDEVESGTTPKEIMLPAGKSMRIHFELAGYEKKQHPITRLGAEDMEIRESLRREALQALTFKPTILAPPRIADKTLFVLHGATLTAADSGGKDILWTVEKLFNETADTRPNPFGGAPIFVNDKSWWYPRVSPMPLSNGKLLLALRSRDLIEVDIKTHTSRTLLSLPAEPIGWPHVEFKSFLAGKTLIAVACADGKIRVYDMDAPASPLWEKPCDPSAPAGEGVPATGLSPRGGGSFVSMSARGHLISFNIVNGQENWQHDLPKGALSETNYLPDSAQENLAAIVYKDGRVTVLDLATHSTVWDLSVAQPMEEAVTALVAKDGVYVTTRGGVIQKYSRDKTPNRPTHIWKRPLDGPTDIPMYLGKKSLFAITNFGTLYAISIADGQPQWRYKAEHVTPTFLTADGDLLYLSTKEGQLRIMNADQ